MNLFTADQAALILNLSPATVRTLARTHNIGRKSGKVWAFCPADLDALAAVLAK